MEHISLKDGSYPFLHFAAWNVGIVVCTSPWKLRKRATFWEWQSRKLDEAQVPDNCTKATSTLDGPPQNLHMRQKH